MTWRGTTLGSLFVRAHERQNLAGKGGGSCTTGVELVYAVGDGRSLTPGLNSDLAPGTGLEP